MFAILIQPTTLFPKPPVTHLCGCVAPSIRSPRSEKDVWTRHINNNNIHINGRRRHQFNDASGVTTTSGYWDRNVDMDELLSYLAGTSNEAELHAVMSLYSGRQLSQRFMTSLLSREPDWRRSLALLDWMHAVASYRPSVFAYNVVLRNVLRARQWALAAGLVDEMRSSSPPVAPDRFTYSTLISHLGKSGRLDEALSWLQKMEQDGVSGDLVLYSTLIDLSRKLRDYSKAISLFSRLRRSGIRPDLVAYNSMIHVFGKARLFSEARSLIQEMLDSGGDVRPDAVSYSTLLGMYAEDGRYVDALSLFNDMMSSSTSGGDDQPPPHLDLTAFNIMIDVYGHLGMAREADRLFWSIQRRTGARPGVVAYNTMLRVYGEAGLFGEAIHLFRLMDRTDGVQRNVVTYNTMISIYGKTLEHEKATAVLREMQRHGVRPDAVSYSTIISIWGKAGKIDRVAKLFQKLRTSGDPAAADPVLYRTMISTYERVGLVGHAKRLLRELVEEGRLLDDDAAASSNDNNGVPRETAVAILAEAGRVEEATALFRRAVNMGEVKDVSVFRTMISLHSRHGRHANAVEVFEKMREAGYFPDTNTIGVTLNAYGKMRAFDRAESVYREMQDEGCMFPDRIHFQMLGLLGAKRDFEGLEALLERLEGDPSVDRKELGMVAAGVYERANRLDDASRILRQMCQGGNTMTPSAESTWARSQASSSSSS